MLTGARRSVSIEETAALIAPSVNMMLKKSAAAEHSNIKAVIAEIIDMLFESNLALKEYIQNKFVGVHPDNRFGDGLLAVDVHDMLPLIGNHGWDPKMTIHATASEIGPTERGRSQRDFNKQIIEGCSSQY